MSLICQCGCEQPIPPNPGHKWREPRFLRGHGSRSTKFAAQMADVAQGKQSPLPAAICQCGCGETIPPKAHHRYKPPMYITAHWLRMQGSLRVQRLAEVKKDGRAKPPVEWTPPSGLCECGCGRQTNIAQSTRRGQYIGYPLRYIHGHHAKVTRRKERDADGRGGKWHTKEGYIMVYAPEWPSAGQGGYVPEHRMVYEQTHGVSLPSEVHVHHVNGNRSDNRPENLIAMTRTEHKKAHQAAQYVIALAYDTALYEAFCEYVHAHGAIPDFEKLLTQQPRLL